MDHEMANSYLNCYFSILFVIVLFVSLLCLFILVKDASKYRRHDDYDIDHIIEKHIP